MPVVSFKVSHETLPQWAVRMGRRVSQGHCQGEEGIVKVRLYHPQAALGHALSWILGLAHLSNATSCQQCYVSSLQQCWPLLVHSISQMSMKQQNIKNDFLIGPISAVVSFLSLYRYYLKMSIYMILSIYCIQFMSCLRV